MAESMKGLKRTCRVGELTDGRIGERVTVMGWVQRARNKGALVFVDLRDRSGLLQLVFEERDCGAEAFERAGKLRSEYVIAVEGTVESRGEDANADMQTGAIEVRVATLRILSEAQTPPFPIENESRTNEELRLRYRYLDLRRPNLQHNLILRSDASQAVRHFLTAEGFLEIETPVLCKSTPEGARDYLVPSRVHPGTFYALPQSPQIFKQLLMCGGYDRYFQIAKCFRDEDLRADRQPEFTQIDLEMSFVTAEDVMDVTERMVQHVCREAIGLELELPLRRMTWKEAMERYGSDKPDTRFGMELVDVTEVARGCGFSVFADAVSNGGSVRGLNVQGEASMPRKKIDALVELAKGYGAKGLAYMVIEPDGSVKSSFAKFLDPETLKKLQQAMDARPGDLLVFAADRDKLVKSVLGALRLYLGNELGLIDRSRHDFLWITEFPLFEWSDEENRFVAEHHPFTMPMEEDLDLLDTDQGAVRAEAYDIVMDGFELGGGSVRIHRPEVQEHMFELLGFTREEAEERFGFMINAFKYGVPPHAGLAIGFDRFVMLLAGTDNIREVIAFPKVKNAMDLMCEAPNVVDREQLEDLHIQVTPDE